MHVFIPDDDDVWSRALVVDERAGDHPDEGRVFTLQREPLGVHASDPAAKDKVDAAKFELTEAQLRGGSLGAGELALQDAGLARGGEGARDMCAALNHLHEAAVLHNLRLRFFAAKPYTYTGDICIAVNPYRWLAELYRDDDVSKVSPRFDGARDELATLNQTHGREFAVVEFAKRIELDERVVEFSSIVEPRDDARARFGARLLVPLGQPRRIGGVEDDVADDARKTRGSRRGGRARCESLERVESRARPRLDVRRRIGWEHRSNDVRDDVSRVLASGRPRAMQKPRGGVERCVDIFVVVRCRRRLVVGVVVARRRAHG